MTHQLTPQEEDEIAALPFNILPENQGNPHDAGQSIWTPPSDDRRLGCDDLAVIRRWDWDDHRGQLSNLRHEYKVYEWDGEDEDPCFQSLTLGKLVAEFIIPANS